MTRHHRRVVRWWHRHVTNRAGIHGKDGQAYIDAWYPDRTSFPPHAREATLNTRTGEIHTMQQGETLADLARRLGEDLGNFVSVEHAPRADCKRCAGSGRMRAGLNSNRFKPCRCTETHAHQTMGRKREAM